MSTGEGCLLYHGCRHSVETASWSFYSMIHSKMLGIYARKVILTVGSLDFGKYKSSSDTAGPRPYTDFEDLVLQVAIMKQM